jgi:hypothetical protein
MEQSNIMENVRRIRDEPERMGSAVIGLVARFSEKNINQLYDGYITDWQLPARPAQRR